MKEFECYLNDNSKMEIVKMEIVSNVLQGVRGGKEVWGDVEEEIYCLTIDGKNIAMSITKEFLRKTVDVLLGNLYASQNLERLKSGEIEVISKEEKPYYSWDKKSGVKINKKV